MVNRLFVLCLLPLVWSKKAVNYEPKLRIDLPPPEETSRMSTRNVDTKWITMPVDHFDPHNRDTFQMRYMVNEELFSSDGSPVFIMVGGEWTIHPGWLAAGNMYQMAVENNGYLIYTEHRYYGQTLPYANLTTENLRFLNVDQAMADLAYFITDLKKEPRFAESKVILYGGSYAANMALWFKQRYPHLVLGGVASSGPIKGKVEYFEYLEVVHAAFLSEGGSQCIAHLRNGIAETVEAMNTETGRRSLEAAYRLCHPLDYDDRLLMGYFSGYITWAFSGIVQTAVPGTLELVCEVFNANGYGATPMEQIGGFLAWMNGWGPEICANLSFDIFLSFYTANSESRAWYYQTCTEYAYFQIAPTSGTVFDPLVWLDVDFYTEVCLQAYSDKFDRSFVEGAVDRVNLMFGALEPDVNNTVNIHGAIDPWHRLGVHDRDLTETSPTYLVPRASHCFDMQPPLVTDTPEMGETKVTARRIVASWLGNE